ncbi:MAG: DUF6048 family protein [Prevotella sp.]
MTPQRLICSSISSVYAKLAVALLLVLPALATPARMQAQSKLFSVAKDSIPLFNGFSVSFDLIGAAMRVMSDYDEYEGALRLNLHNQYFPVVEVGYGSANHERDEVTGLSYKTQAPYFRLGCDLNLLKNKNTPNRLYGGIRYAFTSYKADIWREDTADPVWGDITSFRMEGESCSQHWMEIVFGLDAKLWGPLHAGWAVRYKRRLTHQDGAAGNVWYVPGYGRSGDTRISANFNVIIDI